LNIMTNPSLQTVYLNSKLADNGEQGCENPDEYLFWDNVHPTRIVHQIIAEVVKTNLYAYGVRWKSE
jgi:phospholipase/lecithinase/hemolysin